MRRSSQKTGIGEASTQVTPVYFDSALIAKFYLNEPGREAVRRLARTSGVVVSSGIAVVEISAAFHRKLREGAVEREVFDALNGQFAHDLKDGSWQLIGPTPDLLGRVQGLYSRLDKSIFLRSLDALHLITAKAERFDRVYSSDRHLLNACASVNLQGINPLADLKTLPVEPAGA